MAKRIPIGTSNKRRVFFDPERRSLHLHIVGGPGMGKSKFLEHIAREDILAGHGLLFLDPHGEVVDVLVRFCAEHRIDRHKTIHIIDPAKQDWVFSFNPLARRPGENTRDRVDNVIEALAQVWGEESHSTPAIRSTLRVVLTALIDSGQTLDKGYPLMGLTDPDGRRQLLIDNIKSPIVREAWKNYQSMIERAAREFTIEFGGIRRRFLEILDDPFLVQMFGTPEHAIDFRKVMDNDEIVLVNLKGMGDDRARTLGALLVRELFYVARARNINYAAKHPFYLYIDECGEYLTKDVAKLLAQTRKYGLHAILAHQWLEQLREQSPAIYAGVMAVQNKVAFGGLQQEDAVLIADELFATEYDLEMPVKALIKPTVVGHTPIWLESWSVTETEGEVDSYGTVETTSELLNSSVGMSQAYDADGYPVGGGVLMSGSGSSDGSSSGISAAHADTKSRAITFGRSQTLKPELRDMASAVHSLENVRHMAVARLRSIPKQNAVVKGPGAPSFDIATYDMEESLVPDDIAVSFTNRIMHASPYALPLVQANALIEARETQLVDAAYIHRNPHLLVEDEKDDDEFLGPAPSI